MNLNQLKYFIAVAEQQSFTKAATQYYISQTAITQQVHALEVSLGTKLIDRTTRPISLTPGGKIFFAEARSIIRHMDTAVWRTREASHGLMGTLRIGYMKGYEQSDLPKHLRNFHREYPNILITCPNKTEVLPGTNIYFQNKSDKPIRIFSDGAYMIDPAGCTYFLSLVDETGSSPAYIDCQPGFAGDIGFITGGDFMIYDPYSQLFFCFEYDGGIYLCLASYYFGNFYERVK